jgi:hypothetical protein
MFSQSSICLLIVLPPQTIALHTSFPIAQLLHGIDCCRPCNSLGSPSELFILFHPGTRAVDSDRLPSQGYLRSVFHILSLGFFISIEKGSKPRKKNKIHSIDLGDLVSSRTRSAEHETSRGVALRTSPIALTRASSKRTIGNPNSTNPSSPLSPITSLGWRCSIELSATSTVCFRLYFVFPHPPSASWQQDLQVVFLRYAPELYLLVWGIGSSVVNGYLLKATITLGTHAKL